MIEDMSETVRRTTSVVIQNKNLFEKVKLSKELSFLGSARLGSARLGSLSPSLSNVHLEYLNLLNFSTNLLLNIARLHSVSSFVERFFSSLDIHVFFLILLLTETLAGESIDCIRFCLNMSQS